MSCSLVFLIDDMDSMFFLSFILGLEVFDFTALSPSSFLCSCDEFGRKIYTIAGKEYGHFYHITYIMSLWNRTGQFQSDCTI
jgi:hypothetical protein